jgi:hypothetical protein
MGTPVRSVRGEEGVDLSGGEWQTVALARAFVRAPVGAAGGPAAGNGTRPPASALGRAPVIAGGAQVLTLDEPTAALDAEAEHEVYHRPPRAGARGSAGRGARSGRAAAARDASGRGGWSRRRRRGPG